MSHVKWRKLKILQLSKCSILFEVPCDMFVGLIFGGVCSSETEEAVSDKEKCLYDVFTKPGFEIDTLLKLKLFWQLWINKKY